jgi:Uncharacterized protein conserved in bacteria (DUF2252)
MSVCPVGSTSRVHRRSARATALIALAVAWAPAASRAEAPRRSLVDALAVTTSPEDLAANPQLLARLRGSAHGYFRMTNLPFSQQVCERFQDVASELPAVNLHGDAHVEQYAVTSLGRGLTDFDDSSIGPFVIDIVRFGVSLRLAAQAHRWSRHDGVILNAFFRGYREALSDPAFVPPEPGIVSRVRAGFSGDHARRLQEADLLMASGSGDASALLQKAWQEYVEGLLAEHPELPGTFFAIRKASVLRMGIGSALDRKFLVRVEGPTASDADDVLLEAKEVKDISMIGCVGAPPGAGRVLAGHSRIANQPFHFVGFLHIDGATFWLHAWPDDYAEVSVSSLRSPRDLEELALDAGAQLGRGAPRSLRSGGEGPLREAVLEAFARYDNRIRKEIVVFARATNGAWDRFRRRPPP